MAWLRVVGAVRRARLRFSTSVEQIGVRPKQQFQLGLRVVRWVAALYVDISHANEFANEST
jgi:hypothetical protein